MFGVSFTELMLIGVVALIVVGPQRLPGMMSTVGKWSSKMRRMLFDVRQQSGIDDILRAEGITGGINEIRALRNAVRGNVQSLTQSLTSGLKPGTPSATAKAPGGAQPVTGAAVSPPVAATALAVESDPYANVPYDRSREYPDEGCDAYGAIPDDLWAATQRPVKPFEPPPAPAPAGSEPTTTQSTTTQSTTTQSTTSVSGEGELREPESPTSLAPSPTAQASAGDPVATPAGATATGATAGVNSEPVVSPEQPTAPLPSSTDANASTAT